MTLYEDTRKSYYEILRRKLNEGNQAFSVATKKMGCYYGTVAKRHQMVLWAFEDFITSQNKILSVNGNIIPIDESVFNNFPKPRPPQCQSLDSIRIMLDDRGFQTFDKEKNVVVSDDGNVTHDWMRSYYWNEKKHMYLKIKEEIDLKLSLLKSQEIQEISLTRSDDKDIPVIVGSVGILSLVVIGLLLYSRRGKKT
jgi:hypothetical protein